MLFKIKVTKSETEIEPYKLNELFSLIPEYDGNTIFLSTFLNACSTPIGIAAGNQKPFLVLYIKNKLRDKDADFLMKTQTFVSHLQSYESKMCTAINKQELTVDQKQLQTDEQMILTHS